MLYFTRGKLPKHGGLWFYKIKKQKFLSIIFQVVPTNYHLENKPDSLRTEGLCRVIYGAFLGLYLNECCGRHVGTYRSEMHLFFVISDLDKQKKIGDEKCQISHSTVRIATTHLKPKKNGEGNRPTALPVTHQLSYRMRSKQLNNNLNSACKKTLRTYP